MSNIFQRIGSEAGREANQLESHLPNWMPTWMKHHIGSAFTPGGALGNDTLTQYYAQRQDGQSKAGARQSALGDAMRSAALAALAYEGAGAFGGESGAGAAPSGSGGVGFSGGLTTNSLGDTVAPSLGYGGADAPSLAGSYGQLSPSLQSSLDSPVGSGGMNYGKLLGNALQNYGKGSSAGYSRPPDNPMSPITSAPAQVGTLQQPGTQVAPQPQQSGVNPQLLAALLASGRGIGTNGLA